MDQKIYKKDLDLFMEHYEMRSFDGPSKADNDIACFFQAKYSMFYCTQRDRLMGHFDFDPSIITNWERNPM